MNKSATAGKKLIVNADDFGLSNGINAGIIRSHQDGIVTSTSIVAPGAAFEEAVAQSRSLPALGIGVHLALVEERAVAPADQITSLAAGGLLPRNYGELVKGVVTGRIRTSDIERELRAQIEKCLAAGLQLTHLDSHQHTHALPSLFPVTVKLANEYSIPGIRIPRGWPTYRDIPADRFLAKCVLCVLAHADAALFPLRKCAAAQRFAGLFETGDLSEPRLLAILRHVTAGVTELVCHPGCPDPSGSYASWDTRRQTELASLTSASVKESVRSLGLELINYRQL